MEEVQVIRILLPEFGKSGTWKLYLPLLVIFLVAFFVRYHFLTTYNYPMMIHEQDAVGYIAVAKEMLNWYPLTVTGRPPGYPFIIALFALLPVGVEFAARLASIFMDAMVTIPLYVLSYRLLPRAASIAAAALWAFFGFALAFSTSPLTQSTFLFFLLTAVALVHRSLTSSGSPLLTFLGGVSIGGAFLTRPEGIVVFLYMTAMIVVVRLLYNSPSFTLIIKELLVLVLGFMLLAGPFLAAYRYQTGYWALTNKSAAAVKTQDGVLKLNAQGELASMPEGLALWKEHYGSISVFVQSSLSNVVQFSEAYLQILPRWAHLLSLFGLLALLWERRFTELICLSPLVVVTFPNYIVNISKGNSYNYPLFPLTFICVAAGCEALRRLLLKIGPVRWRGPVVVVSYGVAASPVLLLLFFGYIQADANYRSPGLVEQAEMSGRLFRNAGELIKMNSRPDQVIMTRWGLVGYFADRPVITLPKGEVADVVNYGRTHGVSFLVIDSMSVFSRRQELVELLDPLLGKPVRPDYGLKLIAVYYNDDSGCVVYQYVR